MSLFYSAGLGTAIPDSEHYHPGDEGSGSTLGDAAGSVDFSLNGPTWVSNSAFNGGVGVSFDAVDDDATADLTQPASFTWMIRIQPGNLDTGAANTYRSVISANTNGGNTLVYDTGTGNGVWRWPDDTVDNDVADAQSGVEGSVRILVCRYDDSDGSSQLDVYDGSQTLIGSGSSTQTVGYGGSTTYLGQRGDGSRYYAGEMDPNAIWESSYISDSKRDNWLSEYF